ncbi:hypothetical protein HK405_008393, partial [Cladochytrium tenue]
MSAATAAAELAAAVDRIAAASADTDTPGSGAAVSSRPAHRPQSAAVSAAAHTTHVARRH